MALAGTMVKDTVVRDECHFSTDERTWTAMSFVLRKGQVGGFEVLYFKDKAMSVMAGMTITLDLRGTTIQQYPEHPHVLAFETRRGRFSYMSLKSKDLLQQVGQSLGVPIPGLKGSHHATGTAHNMIGACMQRSSTGVLPGPKPPRSPKVTLVRSATADSVDQESHGRSSPANELQKAVLTKCMAELDSNLAPSPVSSSPIQVSSPTPCPKPVPRKMSQSEPVSSPSQSRAAKPLFSEPRVMLEFCKSEGLLIAQGDGVQLFEESVLPLLNATSTKTGFYNTKVSFVELTSAFVQHNWDLKECHAVGGDNARCTFALRWGNAILSRVKFLDTSNKKKELMEVLSMLGLSLDLKVIG